MKKNKLVLMIITILVFVVLLVGATYAYFASDANVGDGLDFTVITDENNIAFAATSGVLSMYVAAENMLPSQIGNGDTLAAEVTGENNMIVTLAANTQTPIACSYNMYFQWNEGEAYLTPTNANKNEFTLELELQDRDGTGGEGTNKFANETQLTKVVTTKNKTLIVEGAYIVGSQTRSGLQTWVPTTRFYNLTDNQVALSGANFGGKFTIEDVECNKLSLLSDSVLALVSNNNYVSSQDQSIYKVVREEVAYNNQTLDAGVRYEGNDPDNYVSFNGDEEWRIIGVFEGSTIGLEPGKQYTKIIRNTSMHKGWDDYYYYDSETGEEIYGENDWVNSSLNIFLNGEYLNGNGLITKDDWGNNVKSLLTSSKNKIAMYNGNYSTWYLRGLSSSDVYTPDMYIAERITGTPGYKDGVKGAADATTTGAIGIMYPSDFGYAAYGENCDNKTSMTLSNYGTLDWETMETSGCMEVDWLFSENQTEWLIFPRASTSTQALQVSFEGGLVFAGPLFEAEVRPVIYLEASVAVFDGTGTKADPYIII